MDDEAKLKRARIAREIGICLLACVGCCAISIGFPLVILARQARSLPVTNAVVGIVGFAALAWIAWMLRDLLVVVTQKLRELL